MIADKDKALMTTSRLVLEEKCLPSSERYIGEVKFVTSCIPFVKGEEYEIIGYEKCEYAQGEHKIGVYHACSLSKNGGCAGKAVFKEMGSYCLTFGNFRGYMAFGPPSPPKRKTRLIRLED